MSTARLPAGMPPLPRAIPIAQAIPVAQSFNKADFFKRQKLARKKKEQFVFWGIIAGIGGVLGLVFITYIAIGFAGSPKNNERKIAALAAKLERTSNPYEQDRIANQIDALEKEAKENPPIIDIQLNKPFRLPTQTTKFEVNFDSVWIYKQYNRLGNQTNIMFVASYSYKNLGPRVGSPDIRGGELRTTLGHIYSMRREEGYQVETFGMVTKAENEIGKTGRGLVYCYLPNASEFPIDFDICGNINATIKLPQSIAFKKNYWYQPPRTGPITPIDQERVKDDGFVSASSLAEVAQR